MNKKLLLLLFAGASMFMLPACGDDDDDEPKKENPSKDTTDNGQLTDSSYAFTELPGAYSGALLMNDESNESLADSLGVSVVKDGENSITLSLEPIVITFISIDNLSFPNMKCTYEAADDSWNFSAQGLQVELLGGSLTAVVDVNSGKFTKGGKLDFDIVVDALGSKIPLKYSGLK